jgi:hypothetical protein
MPFPAWNSEVQAIRMLIASYQGGIMMSRIKYNIMDMG